MFGSQFGNEISGTPTDALVARHRWLPAEACEFLDRESHLRDVAGPAAVDARVAVGRIEVHLLADDVSDGSDWNSCSGAEVVGVEVLVCVFDGVDNRADTLVDVQSGFFLSTVAEDCEFLRVGEVSLDTIGVIVSGSRARLGATVTVPVDRLLESRSE
mgnify:CR=1 FL=1